MINTHKNRPVSYVRTRATFAKDMFQATCKLVQFDCIPNMVDQRRDLADCATVLLGHSCNKITEQGPFIRAFHQCLIDKWVRSRGVHATFSRLSYRWHHPTALRIRFLLRCKSCVCGNMHGEWQPMRRSMMRWDDPVCR